MFDCPNCANPVPDGATFCNHCWQPVPAGAGAQEAKTTVVEAEGSPWSPNPDPVGPPAGAPAFEAPYRPPAGGSEPPAFPSAPPPPPPPPAPAWGAGPAGYGAGPAAPPPGYGAPTYGAAYGPTGHGAPGYPASAYGTPGYGGYPPRAPTTNGLAIASLVCSLATMVTCITCIPGVILGHVALGQIKHSKGAQEGRGLAIAGLVVGYGFIVLGILFVLVATLAEAGTGG